MAREHHAPRLLVIGLDGCTFRVLDGLIDAGLLPGLAELVSDGRRAVLRSTVPPLTPTAWSSMLTGVNPGKHGVFGFVEFDRRARRARLVSGGDVKAPSVWQMLSACDVRVGVFNVPWTYPPQQVNGFMISGFDAPAFDQRMFYPPELYQRLVERFGPYSLSSPLLGGPRFDLRGLIDQVRRRGQIASWLIDQFRPDAFMMVFTATDYAQHYLWGRHDLRCNTPHQPDDLLAYTYQLVDEQVRMLLDRHANADTTVLVVSDHGARLLRAAVDINRWLEDRGLLAKRPTGSSRRSLLRTVGRIGYRLARLVPGIRQMARRWKVRAAQSWVDSLARELDFERTTAVCVSEYGGVALLGDEQQALVRLQEALAELTDPATAQPVIAQVLNSRELYRGPYVDLAPQVWLVPRDYEYLLLTNWRRSFHFTAPSTGHIVPPPLQAGHDRDGVVILAGAGSERAQLNQTAAIEDIGATALSVMGFAPPADMDGRPLLPPPADASPPPELEGTASPADGAYTAPDQERVERRLQDLGYL